MWTGSLLLHGGYGWIRVGGRKGRNLYAHRLSYELHHGSIPEGMSVLHKCDVRNCVRPDHLFLGTQQDNVQDMMVKGRQGTTGPKPGTGAKLKLTALQIKSLFVEAETLSQDALAKKYGVGQSTVSRILRGKSAFNVTL